MSGIFSFSSDSRDVLLLLLGLTGAVIFFLLYPRQHPLATAEVPTEASEIELKSVEQLSQLGYSLSDYQTEVRLRPYSGMVDSLQRDMGRQRAIQLLKSGEEDALKPYFWEVVFQNPFSEGESGDVSISTNADGPSGESGSSISVRFDTGGSFLELRNRIGQLPEQVLNREVLASVFDAGAGDTLEALPIEGRTDSALTRQIYFDLEQPVEDGPGRLAVMRQNFSRDQPFRLNRLEAERMAQFYVQRSGWAPVQFQRDTVFIQRVGSSNTAVVRLHTAEPVHGQQMRLDVQVAPTGALLDMSASYNPFGGNGGDWDGLFIAVESALIVLFLLACIIVFFYRIRARAVDTRSALVVAILAGLGFGLYFLLSNISEVSLFGDSSSQISAILMLTMTGIIAALSSVGFFILFATSDSVTRQYWPQKLSTYDYIRQGMFFNKPVGSVVLRSVTLALILSGFWTLLLWLLPGLYMEIPSGGVFLDGTAGWPPVYVMLHNGWFSLSAVLGIFLILGSQVWSRTRNRFWVGAATVLACGVLFPLNITVGPVGMEFIAGSLLGLVLTLIYMKWDFSTLLISLFLFLGFVRTAPGWVAPGSPDLYIFMSFIIFLALLVSAGTLAILMGQEERVLPRYVPEYVEELAQEERIKQELHIARDVQQSFLPTRIPQISGIDLAAVCQPAFETGGDYYDFIRLDDHRIAVAIGDVSGKGIQAAFYMTFIKGIIHSLCRETDSPSELLKKTNRLFFDSAQRGTFISLVYGIIDTRTQTFTFARAGHNPALHYDRSEDRIRELQPGGLGIGLTREESFDLNIRESTVDLEDSDILLLYTDGIVEALNEQHSFYGTTRLRDLMQAHSGQTSKGMLDSLFKDVREFIGEAKQHDDMTMVVIRYS